MLLVQPKEVVRVMTQDVSRLLPSERQQRIRQRALQQSVLRISDLAEDFGVSEMTIRRDLEVLEEAGHVERTFGGAVASEQTAFESSYLIRLASHAKEKQAMARYAATLIQDGDTVALDASTTALALAHELVRRELTVITNSLDAAQALRSGQPKVILTGGYLRQVAGSFAGPLALKALHELRIDHAFISAKGVIIPDGLMDSDLDEVEVKRAMIDGAARVTALMDASKFGKRALGRIADMTEISLLVTDSSLTGKVRSSLKAHDIKVHITEVDS